MMITPEGYGVFAVSAVSAQSTDWWCLKWYRGPEDDDADGVHGVNAGVGHACISRRLCQGREHRRGTWECALGL